ncbi:hypothetical protein H4Q26_010964 [Puccinia striiformis f. sp. tritici PST-130]|nr:hypothetical protein H4Q26_010964 [Puccinia striiformis f. sp. tritici PST-130]
MASALKTRLQRTVQSWQRYGLAVVRMDPLGGEPFRRPLPIFEMSDPSHLEQFALGCDADMGGYSTIQLAIQQSPTDPFPHGVFRGTLRSELSEQAIKTGILKSGGYAGFRTRVREMLIGEDNWNAEQHQFLRLRVKNSGDGMKYSVNIQTKVQVTSTDIFQHRLWLGTPGEWEDVIIPLADFALTNKDKSLIINSRCPENRSEPEIGLKLEEQQQQQESGQSSQSVQVKISNESLSLVVLVFLFVYAF